MDAVLNQVRPLVRYPFLVTALAPLIPHLLGSVFNIWYNMVIIDPLLTASGLRARFVSTIICWNLIVYPVAIGIWLRLISLYGLLFGSCSATKRFRPNGSIRLDGAW